MHQPDVINFPAPESHLEFSKSSFNDAALDHTFQHLIDNHPFNSKINIVLPGTSLCPTNLERALVQDKDFYEIADLPLYEFLSPVFLQAFLKSGNTYAVCCNSRLDLDNVAAVTPDGWLILLVDKFTYSELWLKGKLSAHILRRPKDRYIIKVNLKEDCIPGKPYYKKVLRTLKDAALKFTFWMSWVPDDPDVCPSSIAKYFSDKGYEVYHEGIHLKKDLLNKIHVPEIDEPSVRKLETEGLSGDQSTIEEPSENKSSQRLEVEPEMLLEWIGSVLLGIKPSSPLLRSERHDASLFVTESTCPEPAKQLGNVLTLQSSGFYIPSNVRQLIEELRSLLGKTPEEEMPWVSMTVYGHVDSPVTWGLKEHYYNVNGDNAYTLIILRTQVLLYKVSGPRKPFRMFAKCNNNK